MATFFPCCYLCLCCGSICTHSERDHKVREKTPETVKSLECLEQDTDDRLTIMEATSREVSNNNNHNTSNNNGNTSSVYSNEDETVMESPSNNDGNTYNAADDPPLYRDVVNHDETESLPNYPELADDYTYV